MLIADLSTPSYVLALQIASVLSSFNINLFLLVIKFISI